MSKISDEEWNEEDKILFTSLKQQYDVLLFLRLTFETDWFNVTISEIHKMGLTQFHNHLLTSLQEYGVLTEQEKMENEE